MKTYLSAIGTANPKTRLPQSLIAGFMADALQLTGAERKRMLSLYRLSGIGHRHTVLDDYGLENGNYTFFPNTPGLAPAPAIDARMQAYKLHALPLAAQAAENCLQQLPTLHRDEITHLISVSCTGMYAPGLDIELIQTLGLPTNTERTCINFMGCYAAFNAFKLANAFCKANPKANVLIVCTELCTLHFQNRAETDHLISNALFGDGAAAALVTAQPTTGLQLSFESFYCDLAPEGKQDMAWQIGNNGFEMTLSAYIPDLVRKGIAQLTQKLLQNLKLTLRDVSYFAIHPGGTRILKAIEEELGLQPADNRYSYQTLQTFGNMSSATVLFVLQALWQELSQADAGKNIVSFAFGPGLTLEAMLLKVHYV